MLNKGETADSILILKDLEVTRITEFPFHWPPFKSLEPNPTSSAQTSTILPCTQEETKKVSRKEGKK